MNMENRALSLWSQGISEKSEFIAELEKNNIYYRVVSEDEEYFEFNDVMVVGRWNLYIKNGKVYEVKYG